MATSRAGMVLGAVGVVLLTTACGSIAPGAVAAEEFTDHFSAAHPDHVLEAVTTATDELPWVSGRMAGSLILADDTPPEVLTTILEDVTTWEPDADATYDGVGVQANGVCLYASDSQRELKHLLRDRLYAEGLALQGTWGCPNWSESQEPPYRGDLDQLVQDTATVRSVWEEPDGGLRVVAAITDPTGSVDHVWSTLPETLPEVLTAIDQEHAVLRFAMTDDGLRVAVPTTTRIDELQRLADTTAGPDLTVQVMQGSLDPGQAEDLDALAPLGDALRTVPGVESVIIEHDRVTLATRDVQAVRGIYDAALEHPEFHDGLALRIRHDRLVPDADQVSFFYEVPSGSTGHLLPVFVELADLRIVNRLWVSGSPDAGDSSGTGDLSLMVNFTTPLPEALPHVKGMLPDGIRIKATGADHRETVTFTTAPTLAEDDLNSIYVIPDLDAIAQAWNSAG